MAMNRVQFQRGLSMAEFLDRYGSEGPVRGGARNVKSGEGAVDHEETVSWSVAVEVSNDLPRIVGALCDSAQRAANINGTERAAGVEETVWSIALDEVSNDVPCR
jgi:hypothetical protein